MFRLVARVCSASAAPTPARNVLLRMLRTGRARTAGAEVSEERIKEKRSQEFYDSIQEAEKTPEISKEALEHYYKASGTIFSSNPSMGPSMKKIWQSTATAREPIPEFARFEDMAVRRDVSIVRSNDAPPAFGPHDVLPVYTVVNLLLNQYAEDVLVLEQDKNTRHYADYVVIVTGKSSRHLYAIAQAIKAEARRKLGRLPRLAEMSVHNTDKWSIISSRHVVVHLFLKDAREEMNLEEVWMPGQQPNGNPLPLPIRRPGRPLSSPSPRRDREPTREQAPARRRWDGLADGPVHSRAPASTPRS